MIEDKELTVRCGNFRCDIEWPHSYVGKTCDCGTYIWEQPELDARWKEISPKTHVELNTGVQVELPF